MTLETNVSCKEKAVETGFYTRNSIRNRFKSHDFHSLVISSVEAMNANLLNLVGKLDLHRFILHGDGV